MKTTTNRFFSALVVMLLLFNFQSIQAQDDAPEAPEYITVTTAHWNMDYEDFDMDTWKAVEKEYLDKVIKKNDHIMGYSIYLHQISPDNSEIIFVNTYASWDDIDKASTRNGELAREAWPDDDARGAFFDKQSAYYSPDHSDEIYAPMSGAKLMTEAPTKDLICYVRKSHFAFPEDGSNAEFQELRKGYIDNLINKNEYIKAYYPHAHAWGSDRTEFLEAFFIESLGDMDKMFERFGELSEEAWPDEAARKERGKKIGKYFTGVHGDTVYKWIHELSK